MVTMQQIAAKTGVSQATVSLVLNKRHSAFRISEETTRKVKETAEHLGYCRNELAMSLLTNRTHIIGLLTNISDRENSQIREHVFKVMFGAAGKAAQKGYFIKLLPFKCLDSFQKCVRDCIGQRMEGVTCLSLREEYIERLKNTMEKHDIPIALVDDTLEHNWGMRIIADDNQGAEIAIRHLHRLGHKKIGYITMSENRRFVRRRRDAFLQAMAKVDASVSEKNIIYCKNECNVEGHIKRLVNKSDLTAFFCSTDFLAMRTLRAIRKTDKTVPEDISVIGTADLSMANYADPPLTTLAQPFIEMGQTSIEMLVSEIESKNKTVFRKQKEKRLKFKLIVRNSTGPAKG